MRQRKRRIDSWRFSRNWQIKENGQWTRIHERFGKTSIEVTKRGILTNGDHKKTANLGENENFGKMESSRVWPNTNEMTKRGILTNDNFVKMTNLAKIY